MKRRRSRLSYEMRAREFRRQHPVPALARIGGLPRSASSPTSRSTLAGVARHSPPPASRPASLRFCDCFNIPVGDVRRTLPGYIHTWLTKQGELMGGPIKHGAKAPLRLCRSHVPRSTVIYTEGYGGSYDVMSSKTPARRREIYCLADCRDRRMGARCGGREYRTAKGPPPEKIAETDLRNEDNSLANP